VNWDEANPTYSPEAAKRRVLACLANFVNNHLDSDR
jgi:hypothetical protein